MVPCPMATAARVSPEPYREASYDPFEDDMGESSHQRFISELFRPEAEACMAERGGPTFVGADQYIGWDPDDGEKVLAPDVYVLPGVEPGVDFEFWKVWQTGIVPSFALEIVSKRKKKDYTEVPPLYDELGVDELVIFDPRYKRRRREAYRFQVYRRVEGRGFVRIEATNANRVRSRTFGCWIRCVGRRGEQRLRLARGLAGDALVPTAREKAEARAAEAASKVEHGEVRAAEAATKAEHAEARAAEAATKAEHAEARAAEARRRPSSARQRTRGSGRARASD